MSLKDNLLCLLNLILYTSAPQALNSKIRKIFNYIFDLKIGGLDYKGGDKLNKRGIYIISFFFLVFVILTAGCIGSQGMGDESADSTGDSTGDGDKSSDDESKDEGGDEESGEEIVPLES